MPLGSSAMRTSHAPPLLGALLAIVCAQPAAGQQTFGTLVVVEAGPIPANPSPLSAETAAEWRFVELVYAPLYAAMTAPTATATVEPVLAKGVAVEDSGKRLLVSLREDARWSNGQDVTAADVVYTYELARTGKWNRAWIQRLAQVSSVKRADDGLQVIFELSEAVREPERLLTVPLVPRSLHGPLDSPDLLRPQPYSAIGAGPFAVHTGGAPGVLQANAEAIRKPRISEVQIISAGSRSLAADYVRMVGESVTFDLDPADAALARTEFGARRIELPRRRIVAIAFAKVGSRLAEPVVRRAFDRLVDRAELFSTGEGMAPTLAPVDPASPIYPRGLAMPTRDPAEAANLLRGAGWNREGSWLARKADNGSIEELSIALVIDADDTAGIRRVRVIEERLREAGIKLEVDPRPRYEFLSRVGSRKFPAALITLEIGPDGSLASAFHSRGADNITNLASPEIDRALEAGDLAGAVGLIVAADQVVFLGTGPVVGAVGRNVQAGSVTGMGGLMRVDKWVVK